MVATKERKKLINHNLISLKLVVLFTFVGFVSVHILNRILPFYLGLNFDEYRLITIIAPLISMIGPLIVGPLADHLAGKNPSSYGRSLRILTAIVLILAAIFYSILIFIPTIKRYEDDARRPLVSFGCDLNGGVIFQQRCNNEQICHNWKDRHGDLVLTNCSYTCQKPSQFERLYMPWLKPSPQSLVDLSTFSESDYSDEEPLSGTTQATYPIKKRSYGESVEGAGGSLAKEKRTKRYARGDIPEMVYVKPPHLCEKKIKDDGSDAITKCHVYTEHTKSLKVKTTLRGAPVEENDLHSMGWCHYKLDGFKCEIPQNQTVFMAKYLNSSNCKPMVECELIDPYESRSSVLADSTCIEISGDEDVTLTTYFILRPIAEIFPLAALALLNTAIIIATRETSTGRGEVCRQYVWGALGWTAFIPALMQGDIYKIHLPNYITSEIQHYLIALTVTMVISFLVAAVILIFANKMPLSPPEWWWHTKTGMLVYPMSAIRKYFPEMFALCLITLVLGIFWSSIYSYTPWVYKDLYAISYIGCIFLLFLLFNVDKFIEYCGHSNILIAVFALYIIRFSGIHMSEDDTTLTIIMEILEPLYITIAWITVILYMRHIIPRKYTATGQAILVIAHFCLGKSLGALIGLEKDSKQPEKVGTMYHSLAIAACIISLIYFTLYDLILAPRCAAKPQPDPQLTLTNLSQQQQQPSSNAGPQTNGANGNYTPLRVYHNERGKKGQFRY